MNRPLVLLFGLAFGCGASGADAPLSQEAERTGDGGISGAAAGVSGAAGASAGAGAGSASPMPNPLGRYRCQAPAGLRGFPQTIEQAVELLNALPKPTSVACFVESLERPLQIVATNSPFSAQPALSTSSPRIFIKTGHLWTSVVVAGDPSYLLEFGYLIPDTLRSIKGELHLPLTAAIPVNAPYDSVLSSPVSTSCGFCHGDERPEAVPGVTNAFSSIAFQPRSDTHVALGGLRLEAQTCSWQREPLRCELLAAVFDGGPVVEEPFPAELSTFF